MVITLTELINTLINGNNYPEGIAITINRNDLIYDNTLSVYNNLYYKHQPTSAYLFVQHTDDENFVTINVILPNESPKNDYWKHHVADDFSDNLYCWNKLDNDYESTEFEVEYKFKIT